jgi:hypothetical protein
VLPSMFFAVERNHSWPAFRVSHPVGFTEERRDRHGGVGTSGSAQPSALAARSSTTLQQLSAQSCPHVHPPDGCDGAIHTTTITTTTTTTERMYGISLLGACTRLPAPQHVANAPPRTAALTPCHKVLPPRPPPPTRFRYLVPVLSLLYSLCTTCLDPRPEVIDFQ